jgi:arylsulfatase A-like enzyme
MSASEDFLGSVGRYVADSEPWWPAPVSAPTGAPSVVYVVLDDVGFSDLGCYGSEIDTPTMDRLAARGLRFTNFHTTSLCSPTRACLLTGRNHHSVGMGVVANWDTGFPGFRGAISHRAGTLAEILHPHGYNAYAVGKWHLVPTDEMTAVGPYDHWPLQRGFDRFYGFLDGATDQYVPDLVADNHPIDPPSRAGYHLSEDLADQAITMVRDHVSVHPEKPYFLYFCFGAGHYPLQAPPEEIERYRGRYDAGWDVIRAQRFERQKALGIVPVDAEIAPRNPGIRAWDELDAAEQRLASRFMEVYAAFLTHADRQLGRVLDELEALGTLDDTLVALLSDNGATAEGGQHGSVNYMRYANGLPAGTPEELLPVIDDIGGPTTSPMYPSGWAQASNTPLKRYKQNTHAGGIRDPFIVSWPARLRDHGAVRTQYQHVTDVTPTVLDLLGVSLPESLRGVPQMPLEGTSMGSVLDDGAAPTAKRVQYFEMLGNRAIWADGWKAVTFHAPGSDFDADRWELYHADVDVAEVHDLADAEPERLAALVDLWWREAQAHQALPLDDRIMERFLVPKPRPITSRSRFVYRDGIRMPSYGSPDIKNVSYTIDAHVDCSARDVTRGDADGVLLCCGDRFCGYTLFVKDGHLVHDYNAAGTHFVVRSAVHVPEAECVLSYRFEKTGDLCGIGTLAIDGRDVGHVELTRTLGMHISPVGLCIGYGPLSPVSPDYEAPFRFGGVLSQVIVTLGDDRHQVGPPPFID